VQDLNLRPLACHAHISCSPVLSDIQISPNRSTFCPLRSADVCSGFLALLTALLTEYPCNLRKGSPNSVRESHLEDTISWSKSELREWTLLRQQRRQQRSKIQQVADCVSNVARDIGGAQLGSFGNEQSHYATWLRGSPDGHVVHGDNS